jgi:hypothetical protein
MATVESIQPAHTAQSSVERHQYILKHQAELEQQHLQEAMKKENAIKHEKTQESQQSDQALIKEKNREKSRKDKKESRKKMNAAGKMVVLKEDGTEEEISDNNIRHIDITI